MISTGHISPQESMELAKHAHDINFTKLVMGHPTSISVGASLDDMKEMARRKAMIEFCFIGALPLRQRFHPREVVTLINELGPKNCVLSTDAFYEWRPPAPEMLRMFLAALAELGVPRADLRVMVQDNPARLLAQLASG